MPDEEVEASRPPCVRGEHVVAEALGEDPPRAGEILATKPPNDDVEHDVATTERKVGGAAPIAAVDMVGRRAAQRAARSAGDGVKDERDLGGIYGRAIDDEAVRYRITNAKLLIHDADSFSNQSRSDQRTSSKVSQTQSSTPKHTRRRVCCDPRLSTR